MVSDRRTNRWAGRCGRAIVLPAALEKRHNARLGNRMTQEKKHNGFGSALALNQTHPNCISLRYLVTISTASALQTP